MIQPDHFLFKKTKAIKSYKTICKFENGLLIWFYVPGTFVFGK